MNHDFCFSHLAILLEHKSSQMHCKKMQVAMFQ